MANFNVKLQPISMLMYFIFIGLIRLSILAFLPRLNRERRYLFPSRNDSVTDMYLGWFMGCIWALAVVTLFAMLAPFFYVLTECKPILYVGDFSRYACVLKELGIYSARSNQTKTAVRNLRKPMQCTPMLQSV